MSNKNLTIQREMNPSTWGMIEAIAATSTISKVDRPKIARKLLFCFENKLPLSLAVNGGLYEVNGRMEAEGTTIRAQIRKHPNYDYAITRLDSKGCEFTIMLHGEILGTAEFTEADAKQAGLLSGENYKKYPTDMYLNRATSRAYKRFCPDMFMQSIYVNGEISDPLGGAMPQHTLQDLVNQHGNERVLDAMQACDSNIGGMIEYLKEVE